MRSMSFTVTSAAGPAEAVAVLLAGPSKPSAGPKLDAKTQSALNTLRARAGWKDEPGHVQWTETSSSPGKLFAVALGSDEPTPTSFRRAGAGLARALQNEPASKVRLELSSPSTGKGSDANLSAFAQGLAMAGFVFDEFKGAATKPTKPIRIKLQAPAKMVSLLRRGLTVGDGVNHARAMAMTPPNVANPAFFERQAKALARQHAALTCKVVTAAQAQKLGMGGLLGVGQGSDTPPRLVALEHTPPGTAKQKPVLLVGKGITYDTGGYALKPPASMRGMKLDKCGAMAVLGTMKALAELQHKRRVVGLLALAENMVDSAAYRNDDIITLSNGVTVEVTNTDAEGRIVLADALHWGVKTYKPHAVVDLATLTGGVVVALGKKTMGMFSNQDALAQELTDAAEPAGEKLWRLPLWDEHRAMMKSPVADIVNANPPAMASPIQGAAFLSHFVGAEAAGAMPTEPAWAHLDIAGVAESDGESPLLNKGASGAGVRLLLSWLGAL